MEIRLFYENAQDMFDALSRVHERPGVMVVRDHGTAPNPGHLDAHLPALLTSLSHVKSQEGNFIVIATVITGAGRVKRFNARFLRDLNRKKKAHVQKPIA